MIKIGQRLKQERLRLKLSQSALGTSGGVETNAQGNYESGLRFPRADYLSRVAEIGVDVAYVVTGLRIPAASYPQDSSSETDHEHDSNEASQAIRLTNLVERLHGNLHGMTADLYQITRLADARAKSSNYPVLQAQLDDIKGEAEAIALATIKLIYVTYRLN